MRIPCDSARSKGVLGVLLTYRCLQGSFGNVLDALDASETQLNLEPVPKRRVASWPKRHRRLLVRWEKKKENDIASIHFAFILTICRLLFLWPLSHFTRHYQPV
jgi:hypothetical protein